MTHGLLSIEADVSGLRPEDVKGLKPAWRPGWEYGLALERLKSDLRTYEWRLIPFEILESELAKIWDSKYRESVIQELSRRSLTPSETSATVNALSRLVQKSNTIPSNLRPSIDRAVYRLLHRLDTAEAAEVARQCVTGRRKKLRLAGIRYFKGREIDNETLSVLKSAYDLRAEPEILHLLASDPNCVQILGPSVMLEEIQDEYWRMRVMQSLISYSTVEANQLAQDYPIEFVWAAGRLQCNECVSGIRELRATYERNPRFLSLSLWALATMGAQDEFDTTLEASHRLISETLGN